MQLHPYILRRGDTLSVLAEACDVSLESILAENPQILNPNLVRSGELIHLPVGSMVGFHRRLAEANIPGDLPDWLKIAYREEGVAEVQGPGNNPRILEYHASTSTRKPPTSDATAWCSSFANWCMEQAGLQGTDSTWALGWRNWGTPTPERIGCIVVFSRKSAMDSGGHVGFLLDAGEDEVYILGGNQGDAVSRSWFPKNGTKGSYRYKLLAYRWPTT